MPIQKTKIIKVELLQEPFEPSYYMKNKHKKCFNRTKIRKLVKFSNYVRKRGEKLAIDSTIVFD